MSVARHWLRRVVGPLSRKGRGLENAGAASSAPPAVGREPGAGPRGATLVGHPHAVLGVGEYLRAAAKAFAAAGIPFHIRNVYDWNDQFADKHADFALRDRITKESPFEVNIFHMNADEMEGAHRELGAGFFSGRYNIGCWHWELSHFPDAWLSALELVDEVWATSRFIQHAIAEKARCPVIWMPHPVDVERQGRYDRGDLGLPTGRYLFLFAFDFTSYVARKNPFGVLRAFRQAFPEGGATPVGLVIKLNGTQARSPEARAFLASPELHDPRIQVIDEVLDGARMQALIEACDAVVSLHRSEGFGRLLAEAMALGKPVVATGYSGNTDFTHPGHACVLDYTLVPVGASEYPYPQGQVWADPDLEQAAWYMRRLVAEPAYGARLGRRAAAFVRLQHGPAAVGARCRARLEKLGRL